MYYRSLKLYVIEPADEPFPGEKRVRLAAEMAALRVAASDIFVGDPIEALVTVPFSFTVILTVTRPSTLLS